MSDIPDEREITKEQLWKKIEDSIDGVNLTIKGFYDRVDTLPNIVMDQVKKFLEQDHVDTEVLRKNLEAGIKKIQTDLEAAIDDQLTNLKRAIVGESATLDDRNRSFQETILTKVDQKINETLAAISPSIEAMSAKVDSYKLDVEKQIKKYMIELGGKYGQVNGKVETLVAKLKKFVE